MTRPDTERLRAAYEAWNRGEIERIPEFFHPDCVYWTSGVFPGFEPAYHRQEGIHEFWRTMTEPWEYFRIELQDADSREDEIIARVRFVARGAGSGAEVTVDFTHRVTYEEGGRIIEVRAYPPGDQPPDAAS